MKVMALAAAGEVADTGRIPGLTDVKELADEELCAKVAQRDQQAFELLVERHQARAYRLACSILGNEADARDVSQDAFIRLYESAHRFDGRSRFSTWFYRVLVNLCIDHRRRGKWWSKLLPLAGPGDDPDEPGIDPASGAAGPDLAAIAHQSAGQLAQALKRLSPNQRAAVLLQVQEGLSSREIAQVLNCSENTARVHIHRGLAALKKMLKDQ
ncbi:MAG TPA: RNA polymerase sigma factor [Candidatus Binataceae bacterium]|jgi:RNA polymerase sigma-70 factor (ECF subfamily)|nr:RNA polymerase sigma factor [Candidatus Binataceae bacterium]